MGRKARDKIALLAGYSGSQINKRSGLKQAKSVQTRLSLTIKRSKLCCNFFEKLVEFLDSSFKQLVDYIIGEIVA